MKELIDEAARLFDISRQELTGSSRTREVVLARQAAVWALHKRYPDLTLVRIGELLGGRNHATIIAAVARAEQLARTDQDYARILEALVRSPLP